MVGASIGELGVSRRSTAGPATPSRFDISGTFVELRRKLRDLTGG
jgi:hypothetical protein